MHKIVIKLSKKLTVNGPEWRVASHTGLNGIDQLPIESSGSIMMQPEFLDMNDFTNVHYEDGSLKMSGYENPLEDTKTDQNMIEPVVLLRDCFATHASESATRSSAPSIDHEGDAAVSSFHSEKEIPSSNDGIENRGQNDGDERSRLDSCQEGPLRKLAAGKARSTQKPFKCDDCSSTFTREYYLRRHQEMHKRKATKRDAGTDDESPGNEIFHSVFSLRHKLSSVLHYIMKNKCHFKRPRRFRQSRFSSKQKRTAHVDGVFGRERCSEIRISRFLCNVCPAQFENEDRLNSHLNIHKERPFTCNACFRTFTTNHALKAHAKKHKLPTRYICSTCFIEFPRKSFLKEHLEFHVGF